MIILCSAPRSGGNWLLKELMDRMGTVGREYLSKDAKFFIEDIRNTNNICVKIHPSEIGFSPTAFQSLVSLLSGSSLSKLVWLERLDTYSQAESLAGARESGNWFSGSTRGIASAGAKELEWSMREKRFWEKELFRKEKYKILYENMIKDVDAEMNSLMYYLED